MDLFLLDSYRAWISSLTAPGPTGRRLTYAAIATAAGIPKSYLSRVMKGDAHLSPDQLWLLCEQASLADEEAQFLLLLLERDRCAVRRRKEVLETRIGAIRAQQARSEAAIKVSTSEEESYALAPYYLDPWMQVIHIALTIPRYRADVGLVAGDLGLPMARVRRVLDKLKELGIISMNGARISVLKDHLHLSRSSPLCASWKKNLRSAAMNCNDLNPNPLNYSFSVVFSSSEEARLEIQRKWFALLKEIESISARHPEEELFGLNFDLFYWRAEEERNPKIAVRPAAVHKK